MAAGKHRAPRRSGSTGGAARLGRRQLTADPWVCLLLAVVVAALTCAAALWPRLATQMNSDQVTHAVDELSPSQRVLTARITYSISAPGGPVPETVEDNWAGLMTAMEDVREAQPEPLRSLMQPGAFHLDIGLPAQLGAGLGPADDPFASVDVSLRLDPYLDQVVEVTEGDWPEVVVNYAAGTQLPGEEAPEQQTPQVLIAAEAARALDIGPGDELGMYLVTGLFEPTDPGDLRWTQSVNALSLGEVFDGNVGRLGFATVYLPPGSSGQVSTIAASVNHIFYYPIGGADIGADDVGALSAQLNRLESTPQAMRSAGDDVGDEEGTDTAAGGVVVNTGPQLTFRSDAVPVFDALSAQQRATATILAVVAAGPLGVALAAFLLAGRLVISRRQSALSLAIARGASIRQVRTLLAVEGALIGIPAAAVGYLVAGLIRPGGHIGEIVLAVLIAALPAAVLTGAPIQGFRAERSDLGMRGRHRWITEVALLTVAALAVWQTLSRGVTSGAAVEPEEAAAGAPAAETAGGGLAADLLVISTPLLVAAAACVITLRLYPLPLRLVSRWLRASRGPVGFLGATRARRDPVGGIIPVVAVVLGVTVAVTATVMAGTITRGAEVAAWSTTGGEIRLSGPTFSTELREQIAEVDGVVAVGSVVPDGRRSLTTDDLDRQLPVFLVDETVPEVYASTGVLDALPARLFDAREDGAVPILTGGDFELDAPGDLDGFGEVTPVGHVDGLHGVPTPAAFIVVSRGALPAGEEQRARATMLMVGVDRSSSSSTAGATGLGPPGQDPQPVIDEIQQITTAALTTPHQALESVRSAPVTSGLTFAFIAAAGVTLALTVLTLVLVQAIGAPARRRVLGLLRTLGLPTSGARRLTAWEMLPVIAASVLTGVLVGTAVPWLLVQVIDLTGITGGSLQPAVTVDPALLGTALAALVAVVAVAVLISAFWAGRMNLAQHLRIGEER